MILARSILLWRLIIKLYLRSFSSYRCLKILAKVCARNTDLPFSQDCKPNMYVSYRYHKLRKSFSKFYRRYYDLISKFKVGLKSLLRHGLSEPDFYGDLVYKLRKIVGSDHSSAQFIKIISHYEKIGCNNNVLQQTACLVVNPITFGNFAFLFNCTPVGRTSDSMTVST